MAREKNDNKHRKKELLSMKRYTMTIDRLIDVGQMVWLTTSENTEEMLSYTSYTNGIDSIDCGNVNDASRVVKCRFFCI